MQTYEELLTEKINNILLEASETSLHQLYDKVFGNDAVSRVLSIDPTQKKKIAEWLLKIAVKENQNKSTLLYISLPDVESMVDSVVNGNFQIFNYKSVDEALDAHENYKTKINGSKPLRVAFDDGTVQIYIPESPDQLRYVLLNNFNIDPDDITWCVAASDRERYFQDYCRNGKYKLYLINSPKGLYLWNDNPEPSAHGTPKYTEFIESGETVPVDPFGVLTKKAISWLDSESAEGTPTLDFISKKYFGHIRKRNDPEKYYFLNNRVLVCDSGSDVDDAYDGYSLDLETANNEIVQYDWCDSEFSVKCNYPNFVVLHNEGEYYDSKGESGAFSIAGATESGEILSDICGNIRRYDKYGLLICFDCEDFGALYLYDENKNKFAKIYCRVNSYGSILHMVDDEHIFLCGEDKIGTLISTKTNKSIANELIWDTMSVDNNNIATFDAVTSDLDPQEWGIRMDQISFHKKPIDVALVKIDLNTDRIVSISFPEHFKDEIEYYMS